MGKIEIREGGSIIREGRDRRRTRKVISARGLVRKEGEGYQPLPLA
jgi:hypothetical protein